MTTAADDSAVEEAFEAYLAGRGAPVPGDRLVSFAAAVRASATEPGRPSAALADLLASGLLTDQSSPSARTARSTGRTAPAARRGRIRRSRMFFPALLAKLASAGLLAKAATGTGIVVVGLSTAGFTGVLPGSAQHTFAVVVDTVTPLQAPDRDSSHTATSPGVEGATLLPETSPTATPTATPTGTEGTAATTSAAEGDESESEAHPSNYGQQVSEWAHQKNEDRKANVTPLPTKPSKSESPEETSGDSSHEDSGHGGSDH
jgi:hypothetical protein